MKDASIRFPMIDVISKMHSLKKKDIILDSIVVYGLVNGGCIGEKADYQLHVVNDNVVIYPMGNYEKWLLKCERVLSTENAVKITTLADKYKI